MGNGQPIRFVRTAGNPDFGGFMSQRKRQFLRHLLDDNVRDKEFEQEITDRFGCICHPANERKEEDGESPIHEQMD